MENSIDWPTWIQAAASVLAILLAVFMPRLEREATRKERRYAVVKSFRASIREIEVHVKTMEKVLTDRLSAEDLSSPYKADIVLKTIGELEHMIQSQIRTMESVEATDLIDPGMATIPSALQRSVVLLKTSVVMVAETQAFFPAIIFKYSDHRKVIEKLIFESDEILKKAEKIVEPRKMLHTIWEKISSVRLG